MENIMIQIDIILKIAGVGILVAVLNQILKITNKDEISTFVTLSGIIVVLMMVLNLISTLLDSVKTLFNLY
jgi:stage III sporulation protein AC